MAMLAERKRKTKWALNPRGKLWSDDSNKFGQKILEKMGWSSGKGLGVNECGITEHIKVSYKNDSQGIGYKDQGDQWTQHEDQFNTLLSSLNGDSNDVKEEPEERVSGLGFGYKEEKPEKKPKPAIELSGESLEEKSKNSKARVHYKKFTRGKDISRYSEKDLANIFGKKTMVEKSEEPAEKAPVLSYGIVKPLSETEPEKSDTKDKDLTFGITTLESKMSIADYFKSKMPKLASKSKKFVVGPDGVLKSVKHEENEEVKQELEDNRVSFKLDNAEITSNDCEEEGPPKRKKSKKQTEDQVQTCNGGVDESISEESNNKENMETENSVVSKNKKKKRSKKQMIESDEQQNCDNANNDIVENSNANLELQNNDNDTVQNEIVSKKSKKNKIRLENSVNHEQDSVQENLDNELNNADNEKPSKKNKKKRKRDMIKEDPIESNSIPENTEVLENVINENQVSEPKKKKQKNSKTDSLVEVENTIEQNNESSTDVQTEIMVNEGEEIPKLIENDIVQNSETTKKKKKKNKKSEQLVQESVETNLVVEETAMENVEQISNESNVADEGGLKKKKKRKNKVEVESVSNTELSNQLEESPPDQNPANAEVVSKPKKKKRAPKNTEDADETKSSESIDNGGVNAEIVVAAAGNDESKAKNKKKKLGKKSVDQSNETVDSQDKPAADQSQNLEVNKKSVKNINKQQPEKVFLGEKNVKQKIREAQERGEEILLDNAFAGANIFEIPGYGVPCKP